MLSRIRWVRREIRRDVIRCVVVLAVVAGSILWAVYGGPTWSAR